MSYNLRRGISSVIGVVLIVAVVVALVGLVGYTSFTLVGDNQTPTDSADATVDISETSSGLEATVIRNENVEQFEIRGPNNDVISILSDVGDSSQIVGTQGQYSVVARLSNNQEEVLRTITVEDTDFSGLFVVDQDEDNKEVVARLERQFDTEDRYEIVLNAEDNTGRSDAVNTGLTGSEVLNKEQLLKREIPDSITPSAVASQIPLVNIGVDRQEQDTNMEVGESVKIHEITNLCVGDQILLTGENGNTVLSGEEVRVNINCEDLRTVAEYDGVDLVGAELINLGRQKTDYFAFEFNGSTPPPTRPAPDGNLDITVEVLNSKTDDPIESSEVILGDRNGTTETDGTVTFTGIAEGSDLNLKAAADGYYTGYRKSITANEATDKVTIRLDQKSEFSFPINRKFGTINSGESITYDSSGGSFRIGSDSAANTNLTDSDISNFSSQNNRVVSGTEVSNQVYGSESIKSTKTFGSQSPITSPEISNDDEQSLLRSTQPKREFNVLKVDSRSIPNDREFQIRTSIKNTGSEEVTDTVKIFAESTSTSDTVELAESDVLLPPDEEVIDVQDLNFEGKVTGEYTVFVTLSSVETAKEAGTLELFDSDRTDATFDPSSAEITPNNPTIKSGETVSRTLQSNDNDLTITLNGDGISGASKATVELFENGKRVATKEMGSSDSLSYSRNFNEPQYVQYHVGILESKEVVLVDTVAVREENEVTLSENNVDISISNKADVCTQVSSNSEQFDCEVSIGEQVQLDGTGSVFGTGNGDYLQEGDTVNGETVESVEYSWKLGSEGKKVVDKPNTETVAFSETGIQYIELRSKATIGGKKVVGTDSTVVNVYQDPTKITSRIVDVRSVGEFVSVRLKSNRSSIYEDVTLEFSPDSETGSVDSVSTSVPPTEQGVTESIVLKATDYDESIEIGESTNVLLEVRDTNNPGSIIDSETIAITEEKESAGSTFSEPSSSAPNDLQQVLDNMQGDGSTSNPYVITNDQQLQAMNQSLSSNYVLGNNINASKTDQWYGGNGFKPIGSYYNKYTGNFDGNNYTISQLHIDRDISDVGLISATGSDSIISNINIKDIEINTGGRVGGIVGTTDKGTIIKNSSVTGVINNAERAGGIVGSHRDSTIIDSDANMNISGTGYLGGIAGETTGSNITNSHASGDISGSYLHLGGLVGRNYRSTIDSSYATGDVMGSYLRIGGLVGDNNYKSTITNSYATGDVTGDGTSVGGLAGRNDDGQIEESYAIGDVDGNEHIGGFVGLNNKGKINTSYSTGSVNGNKEVGGFSGRNEDTITDSYWDTRTSGQSTSAGGTGLTTFEMQGSNLNKFDFTSTWETVNGEYPVLKSLNKQDQISNR